MTGHVVTVLMLTVAAVAGRAQPPAGAAYVRVVYNLAPVTAALEQRIAREPDHISNRLELARVYDAAGSREAAERTLLQALAIERSPRVYRQLVSHYRRFRDYPRAVSIAEEWSVSEPSAAEPLVELAELHLYHPAPGDERRVHAIRGLAYAGRALTLAPDHVPALEVKRQLLALQWLASNPADRPAIEAAQAALARVFSVTRSADRASPATARRPLRTASGQAPRYVRRRDVPEPALLLFVEPRYPAEAVRAGIQGSVWFEVLVDENGKVTDARPVALGRQETPPSQLQVLEEAALDAVRGWRFAPTLVDGKPVPVVVDSTVQFVLNLTR